MGGNMSNDTEITIETDSEIDESDTSWPGLFW
jgi:hypothetical protein